VQQIRQFWPEIGSRLRSRAGDPEPVGCYRSTQIALAVPCSRVGATIGSAFFGLASSLGKVAVRRLQSFDCLLMDSYTVQEICQ
jgi:hypothetical protein